MKNVLVTGASSGIGLATIRIFLSQQYNVYAHYRTLSNDLKQLNQKYPHLNLLGSYDLSNLDNIYKFITCIKSNSPVHILVNNAGLYKKQDDFLNCYPMDVLNTFNVNVVAPLMLCQAVLPCMMKSQWGRIVNISSISVKHGGSSQSIDYTFTKTALESMTNTLSKEYSKHNILINALRVGVTDTKFHALNQAKNMEQRASLIPMKRIAQPEEIAEAIYFLSSEKNTFITGSVVDISGGE